MDLIFKLKSIAFMMLGFLSLGVIAFLSVVFNRIYKGEFRNGWNFIMDFAIEMMQRNRLEVSKHITPIREFMDKFVWLPCTWGVWSKRVSMARSDGSVLNAEWLNPNELKYPHRVVLYFHGGGFSICGPNTHRLMVSYFAKYSGTRVLLIGYRRAGNYKYPSQIIDGITAYKWLQSKEGGSYDPKNIIFIGDSAGGNLALTTALYLRNEGHELPGRLVVMSPWGDLTITSDYWTSNYSTDYLPHPKLMQNWVNNYVPEGTPKDLPTVSPSFADYTNFPPVLIQVSDSEQLYGDSLLIEKQMKNSKVKVSFQVWNSLPHMWHAFESPQSSEAIKISCDWIQQSYEHQKTSELLSNECIPTTCK